jgi:hypothetical protein
MGDLFKKFEKKRISLPDDMALCHPTSNKKITEYLMTQKPGIEKNTNKIFF